MRVPAHRRRDAPASRPGRRRGLRLHPLRAFRCAQGAGVLRPTRPEGGGHHDRHRPERLARVRQRLGHRAPRREATSKAWHFKTTPPLPPYLIAVVAGKYHTVERKHRDIPMALWCRESLAKWVDEQAEEIFEITAAGLDFFEKYFGLSYPFDEYNQLFVPEFNMGAMENPGCVTFNEAYIHRGQASEAQLQRRAETILHEMAHVHGFGDVTTMRWWGDLWLNETFATYMANLALEKSTRFTNAWVDFANSVKSIAARQDQLVTTHRIADHVPDTVSVRQNFDGITYHKGASVMRQLVAWVGDDAFKRGVQDYFKRYRWGNADLQEFLDCLRRASGRDLTQLGSGLAADHRDQHVPRPPRGTERALHSPSRSSSPPSRSIRRCAPTARASASTTATPRACCGCASGRDRPHRRGHPDQRVGRRAGLRPRPPQRRRPDLREAPLRRALARDPQARPVPPGRPARDARSAGRRCGTSPATPRCLPASSSSSSLGMRPPRRTRCSSSG